ncbi:MAG TPA: radical SAM protein [Vicinamibacterales bacterium]|nr:radical SAM protein [Vicinamibacterales bacterium]
MSLNYLATRFQCTWPWEMLVMLCDGRIVCGCADPYAKRVLGDVRTSSVEDVWRGPTITTLRGELNEGGSAFCGDCALKRPLADGEALAVRPLDAGRLPGRMFIECTAACNISCFEACCAPETGITRTRQAGMLDVDLFRRVIDEVGPSLARIDFFNYGEAFLHKRAVEMVEYIKSHHPHIYVYTSTNGTAQSEEQARRLVHSGIDEVTFSIDGARADSYARYRQRGRFDVALRNLQAMADEKRRAGRDLPFLNWRYILFTWNDSDEEMSEARRLAVQMGVDRLCWEITDHPENAFSRRFVVGSPDYEAIRRETWDDSNLGNAIPGATPRARIDIRPPLPVPGLSRLPIVARAARPFRVKTRVHNLSTRAFPADATYGRRLVRLGAQLCDEHGRLINLDFARARLPRALEPGGVADIDLEIPPVDAPGRYALKFDLVSEGVDWFEKCGSPTTLKPLWVR